MSSMAFTEPCYLRCRNYCNVVFRKSGVLHQLGLQFRSQGLKEKGVHSAVQQPDIEDS